MLLLLFADVLVFGEFSVAIYGSVVDVCVVDIDVVVGVSCADGVSIVYVGQYIAGVDVVGVGMCRCICVCGVVVHVVVDVDMCVGVNCCCCWLLVCYWGCWCMCC